MKNLIIVGFIAALAGLYLTNEKKEKSEVVKSEIVKPQKEETKLFRNLEAEQARKGYTNSDVAKLLGISRVSYENKKKTGKFTTFEIKILCKTFNVKFDYLFEEVRE